jgi:hypothetical protein
MTASGGYALFLREQFGEALEAWARSALAAANRVAAGRQPRGRQRSVR